MSGTVKIGIMGAGGIARKAHLPAYKKLNDVEVVAVCDAIPERSAEVAAEFGIPKHFSDYRRLLEIEEIDAVSVCMPNYLHAPAVVAALEAGKHVLCEKPLARNSSEGEAMLAAARSAGKILTVAYQSRFSPEAIALKSLIDAGELGYIYFARASALRRRGVPVWGDFLVKEKSGGGPLIDIGTHLLDLTLWLMGFPKPTSVLGSIYKEICKNPGYNQWGPWDPEKYEVEDSAFGFIKFDNGATVSLECSFALNIQKDIWASVLCGDRAGAEIHPNEGILKLFGEKAGKLYDTDLLHGESPNNNYDREIDHFVRCVKGEAEPVVAAEQALSVTRILDAIYESAGTGRAIEFDRESPVVELKEMGA